jgi:CDP-diacylglycerol--glycerol-3-phosphate 3-phosphatidyltransferase
MAKGAWKDRARVVFDPLVIPLAAAGVSPLAVTLFGLLLNIVSAVVIGSGRAFLGGALLVVASICDALDGQLARRTGKVTRFGAFIDSTVDRVDETVVLAGIAAYFLRGPEGVESAIRGALGGDVATPDPRLAVLALVALGGSLITSYTRARAEGLGLECKVGVFERPERVIVTVLGLLAGRRALAGATIVLAVLSWFTVLQRVLHVRRVLSTGSDAGSPPPG